MKWIDSNHGLRTEPSGAITIAALLTGKIDLQGEGDIAVVLSGRNVDSERTEITARISSIEEKKSRL